jgi:hypothetical protein
MKQIFIISILFFGVKCVGQNVGVGTTTPNATAILEVSSNSKGMLLPRLSTAARLAIASPAQGLTVFDTDSKAYWYFSGITWERLTSTADNQNLGFGGWGDCATNYNIGEYQPVAEPLASVATMPLWVHGRMMMLPV